MPNDYMIQNTTLTGMADEVRKITNSKSTQTPSQMASAIAAENTNLGTQTALLTEASSSLNNKAMRTNNINWLFTNSGIDLTRKFSGEISKFSNPWDWIKSRITAANYQNLNIGDYIPFTTANNYTFQAQIAGIDTYYGYGDTPIKHHIDFITRELWPVRFQMNKVSFNNGISSTKKSPWLASNGYLYLNSLSGEVANSTTVPVTTVSVNYTTSGVYYYLPTALKNVIIEKRAYIPTRYSASGVLSNDNGAEWTNIGKLWLPDEYELTGTRMNSSREWFCGGFVHYPIFAHSFNRVKRFSGSDEKMHWFTSSAPTTSAGWNSVISDYGTFGSFNASNSYTAPICFRISA